MKIEKLTDNKIRIILNLDDLAKKNIDINSLVKNTNSTQNFFKKLLKQAQKEVDFDIEDSKLLIEAFISADGFFVLTFTKIENKPGFKKSVKYNQKRKTLNTHFSTAVYDFESFDEFCGFCTYVANSRLKSLKSLAKNISLYQYNSKYFLILTGIDITSKDISVFYALISEFARLSSNSDCFVSRLREFGNIIFKNNAIEHCNKFLSKA